MRCKHTDDLERAQRLAATCECQPLVVRRQTSEDERPEEPIDPSGRVLLIVEKGSVVSKPSHVDLVEIAKGSWTPIVVRNGDF